MNFAKTSHDDALLRITQAGIAIEPRGKAYLLTGRGELLVGDLGNVAEADINRLSGLARSPMRAAFCTRRKCR